MLNQGKPITSKSLTLVFYFFQIGPTSYRFYSCPKHLQQLGGQTPEA